MAILGTIGQVLLTRAYGKGRPLVSAALSYSGIVFSAVLGIVVFGDRLPLLSWLGIALIVVAGTRRGAGAASTRRSRRRRSPTITLKVPAHAHHPRSPPPTSPRGSAIPPSSSSTSATTSPRPEHWGEERYAQGHLPGARFAHLDRDLSAPKTGRNGRHPLPDPADAARVFGRLGIGAASQVVAYDNGSGMFAVRLWWMLRWLGHEAVAVLDGGFEKWSREGRPVTADVPLRGAAGVPGPAGGARRRRGGARACAAHGASLALVDARAAERYRGDVEPLDPVAGHIPGARNRPFAANLNPDLTFKPADVLRAEFADLLGTTPLDRVVHYCGSGVSACHNLLAMEIAGLPGTRLYPGSWSEWCADASRPVATGTEGKA